VLTRYIISFADVHYYFSDPASKPQHHRFARGSYLYLYHSPDSQRAKLEIANHAGTPDQDAFSGCLQEADVHYSHKQPTLFTFKVDQTIKDEGQWHLPGYDARNEQKYLYRLHTLDVCKLLVMTSCLRYMLSYNQRF